MTPGFSPPEQYGSGRTDSRTDIYSLGATLYAALTAAIPEDSLERAMGRAELTPVRKRKPERQRRPGAGGREGSGGQARGSLPVDGRTGRRPGCQHLGQPADGRALLSLPRTDARGGGEDGPLARGHRRSGARPSSPTLAVVLLWRWSRLVVTARRRQSTRYPMARWPAATAHRLRSPSPCRGLRAAASDTLAVLGADRHASLRTPSAGQPVAGGGRNTHRPGWPARRPWAGASARWPLPRPAPVCLRSSWPMSMAPASSQLTTMTDGACQPSWSPDGQRLVFTSPCRDDQDRYPGAGLWLIQADGGGLTSLPDRSPAATSIRPGRRMAAASPLPACGTTPACRTCT